MKKTKGVAKAEQTTRRTSLKLGLVAMAMFAFGYALVPLYSVICTVTGLNGKTGRAEATVQSEPDQSRWITVEFTGTTMSGLPWDFRPLQKAIRVHPGELNVAWFEARNTVDEDLTGQAVPSLAPNRAASHFKKTECFCFTRQTLKGHETRRMPVRFIIDKTVPKEVETVTLAYAFFNTDTASARKFGGQPADSADVAAHEHDHHGTPPASGS
jgi:cytochrome c oxidase assembly protein subunit 11